MTEPRLGSRRIEQLQRYAEGGVTPIDPVAVAATAMAARRRWGFVRRGRAALVLVVGLVLGLSLALSLSAGSRPSTSERRPALFTALEKPGIDWAHIAVRLRDGRVLLVGSVPPDPTTFELGDPAASIWDPATAAFARTGDPTTARDLPAAAMLPDGRVLVAGGGEWGADRASASAE